MQEAHGAVEVPVGELLRVLRLVGVGPGLVEFDLPGVDGLGEVLDGAPDDGSLVLVHPLPVRRLGLHAERQKAVPGVVVGDRDGLVVLDFLEQFEGVKRNVARPFEVPREEGWLGSPRCNREGL